MTRPSDSRRPGSLPGWCRWPMSTPNPTRAGQAARSTGTGAEPRSRPRCDPGGRLADGGSAQEAAHGRRHGSFGRRFVIGQEVVGERMHNSRDQQFVGHQRAQCSHRDVSSLADGHFVRTRTQRIAVEPDGPCRGTNGLSVGPSTTGGDQHETAQDEPPSDSARRPDPGTCGDRASAGAVLGCFTTVGSVHPAIVVAADRWR